MSTYNKNSGLTVAQRERIARNKAAAAQRRADVLAGRRGLPSLVSAFPMAPRSGLAPSGLFNARMMGIEKKFIENVQAVANLATAGIFLVNGVIIGNDFNNRVGREIKMKSLYMRLSAANLVDQESTLRIMLVYDKQPNGVGPAITDILTSADVNAPNNLNNRERFIVITDKVRTCSTAAQRSFWIKKYKPLNTSTQYSGSGATIASIATGAMYLILIPQVTSTGAPSANYSVGYQVRVRFTDQ
jgi:hypothetical protein